MLGLVTAFLTAVASGFTIVVNSIDIVADSPKTIAEQAVDDIATRQETIVNKAVTAIVKSQKSIATSQNVIANKAIADIVESQNAIADKLTTPPVIKVIQLDCPTRTPPCLQCKDDENAGESEPAIINHENHELINDSDSNTCNSGG